MACGLLCIKVYVLKIQIPKPHQRRFSFSKFIVGYSNVYIFKKQGISDAQTDLNTWLTLILSFCKYGIQDVKRQTYLKSYSDRFGSRSKRTQAFGPNPMFFLLISNYGFSPFLSPTRLLQQLPSEFLIAYHVLPKQNSKGGRKFSQISILKISNEVFLC